MDGWPQDRVVQEYTALLPLPASLSLSKQHPSQPSIGNQEEWKIPGSDRRGGRSHALGIASRLPPGMLDDEPVETALGYTLSMLYNLRVCLAGCTQQGRMLLSDDTQSCSKRLRVTGTGKVVGRHACKQHFNEKMDRATIRCGERACIHGSLCMHACLPTHDMHANTGYEIWGMGANMASTLRGY